MPTHPDADAIHAALATVHDPEIHRPITEIGMLKGVDIHDGGVVDVGIYLTVEGCPMRSTITDRVVEAVTQVPDVSTVNVELDVMSEDRKSTRRTPVTRSSRMPSSA